MKIIWMEEALQDLDRIEQFLFEKIQLDNDIILSILNKIWDAPKKLFQFSKLGQLINIVEGEEVRRILVNGYKIYYKVEYDTVVILNVIHAKQDTQGVDIKVCEE